MLSVYDSGTMTAYFCAVAAVLGAVMGSFLNCAAWRIAHEESFLKGRSHCPECGHELGVLDLIPVFGWLLLRGRCRYCKKPVSPRYLIVELVFAALTVACLLKFDLTIVCLRNYVFLCCLFCLSLVDLECMIIPDGCLIIPAAVWLATLPFLWTGWKDVLLHLLAAVVFGGGTLLISLIMDRLLGKESLGGGDVKLLALVGLYLGLAPSLFALLLACLIGLLFFVVRMAVKKEQGQFPFGPSIAAAAVVMLLWGGGLVDWYLNLFA